MKKIIAFVLGLTVLTGMAFAAPVQGTVSADNSQEMAFVLVGEVNAADEPSDNALADSLFAGLGGTALTGEELAEVEGEGLFLVVLTVLRIAACLGAIAWNNGVNLAL